MKKNLRSVFLHYFLTAFAVLFFFVIFHSSSFAIYTWQKHLQNPIFNRESGNSWDSSNVNIPSIFLKNDSYYMLYTGNSNSGWKIGYTYSLNGINSWTRINQPILQIGSTDGWESETADPAVIYDSNTYKLWYTSINTSHWASGLDRFRTRYAFSNDGVNWVRYDGWVLQGSTNYWDKGGTARGKSVVYRDGIYHMWYAGTNDNDLGSNPYWRIGYATSIDGINWTKQNNGNPVIIPTTSWELNNVSYPNVVFENGIYKMWYAAGSGDLPTQIVYATSTDGINWTKPQNQNPVLTRGSSGFDITNIASPFVLHEGNLYKMWYSGFNGSMWSIGYATKSADLDISLIKQTSEPWQSQEYDSAISWNPASFTINSWGCALTSAAMVLKYHGINLLPDGTSLDPGSLNTWLKNQSDGYINTGWINWLAISRLSKLAKTINNITTFDALEYSRIQEEDKTQLTADLDSGQPVILEEPGHFIVAKGINGNTFDINDPFYDRSTLNDGYSNTFLTMGRYTPSFTNLSYLMLVSDPNVDLIISSASGQVTSYLQNGITNPITNQTTTSSKFLLISKPVDGNYSVSVSTSSASAQSFSLKVYEYTTNGIPTINTFTGYSRNDEPATYFLSYQQSPLQTQENPTDTTPPQIVNVRTLDTNNNGKLDRVRVTFARDIYGSTVNGRGSDFLVEGYTIKNADEVNTGVVEITLAEKDTNDTGQIPQVTLIGNGNNIGIKDIVSRRYNNTQIITPVDGASPTRPTINIDGGDYFSAQTINLTSLDSPNNPTIYYTLDGTDPATSSSRLTYNNPITINDDIVFKAISEDTNGNQSLALNKSYGIAPTIYGSSVTATASANGAFTVSWTTNRPSHSRVVFGNASKQVLSSGEKYGYDRATTEDTTRVTNHSVNITGLTKGRTYYYRVLSRGSPEQVGDEQSILIPNEDLDTSSSESSSSNSSSDSTSSSSTSSSSNSSSNSSSSSSPLGCNDSKPTSAPTLLSAFAGINTVALTWIQASDPVSYYLIAYGTKSGKPLYGNPNIGGKGITSFVVENLSGGVTYYFKIRAGNGCTPGDFSNEISATPIGFSEEGLATGFTNNVLGAKTEKVSSKKSSLTPTVFQPASIQKVQEKEDNLKTEFIILLGGFVGLGIYLAKLYLNKL